MYEQSDNWELNYNKLFDYIHTPFKKAEIWKFNTKYIHAYRQYQLKVYVHSLNRRQISVLNLEVALVLLA